ncbi:zeta toxin family protein [Acetobacter senegalensis]|uniref:zeta toxin family protein n=1 Tax=Acetobacter senegalensis TaxID=446692 RepID=UPI001EDDE389|nr:zeta toxin family protein [Acetobacter senegalensis]MCG4274506.1 zeta toxin family protein [Acetobacter senegalensis]
MTSVVDALQKVREAQAATKKPLAIVLAGHNGSGKSTLWRGRLADVLQIPLINADRMMLSILPEANSGGILPVWATELRDGDERWMRVAQQGVQAFVGHAMNANVPFALETVFSYWQEAADGKIKSKVDLIKDMQAAGYFVLLIFVGLTNENLSVLRVQTRVAEHGHAVDKTKLLSRFPRTQKAIAEALKYTDASLLTDNSRTLKLAFTVCRVEIDGKAIFDCRENKDQPPPKAITDWLDVISPPP